MVNAHISTVHALRNGKSHADRAVRLNGFAAFDKAYIKHRLFGGLLFYNNGKFRIFGNTAADGHAA